MTTPSCKFKVGDAVVFEHERCYDGQPVKGVVTDVNFQYKFPISTELEKGVGLQCFTADGRLHMEEDPSLRLASETPTWTVILLYPDYMTDDFGADLYVDSAEADDPYEAVKLVQGMAADANADVELSGDNDPNDFRCIGVIKGEHSFVLDATSF